MMHEQLNLRTIILFDDRCSQKWQEFHQQTFYLCEKVVFMLHFCLILEQKLGVRV